MDSNSDDVLPVLGVVITAIAIGLFIWFGFLRLDHVEVMSVRDKGWSRLVRELEDYQEWVCHTRYREVCSGYGEDRKCHDESYRECGWETKTREINRWSTTGMYPQKPRWATGYTIGSGHYERREESYLIHLSNDKEIWNQTVYNEATYDAFPIRGKCKVGLSWFKTIVSINDCR